MTDSPTREAIDRAAYVAAVVLLQLRELEDRGLIVTPMEIDVPHMTEWVNDLEAKGELPPADDEIDQLLLHLFKKQESVEVIRTLMEGVKKGKI